MAEGMSNAEAAAMEVVFKNWRLLFSMFYSIK
jgi:hypothetical protein